jgi:GR25 family glycosyltransferase involved in LPS biosynthesis
MINKIKNIIDNYKVNIYNIVNSNNNELSFINTNIAKIYVINLKTNIMRRNYIYVLMKKFSINYTLIIVDKISENINTELNYNKTITKSELGCLLSHLWCLNDIIKNKYINAIIFEDDIIFHKKFISLFANIFSTKHNFLLLGACDFSFNSLHQHNVLNNLYQINKKAIKVYGAHANYYSLSGATKMFELHTKKDMISFFDKIYQQIFEYFKDSAFICYPNLVVSDISTSNLHHKYPLFSIAEKNYYSKCFVNFNFNDYHFIYLYFLEKKYPINSKDTYESYINRILYYYFHNRENINKIKKRLDTTFFTSNDLNIIMFNI